MIRWQIVDKDHKRHVMGYITYRKTLGDIKVVFHKGVRRKDVNVETLAENIAMIFKHAFIINKRTGKR